MQGNSKAFKISQRLPEVNQNKSPIIQRADTIGDPKVAPMKSSKVEESLRNSFTSSLG